MPRRKMIGTEIQGAPLKCRTAKVVRGDIARHAANRPHYVDINGLTQWALRKEQLECELAIAEGRQAAVWVDVPGRKGKVAA